MEDEQSKPTKPSLWKRWRQQTWKRRFTSYCCGFVLLIVAFYVIENTRGTIALNAAKQRAADAGIELDFATLMTREMPPDEENFATCLPAMEEVSQFKDLERELKPLKPRNEHRRALPRYVGIEYAVRDDFSYKLNQKKDSHAEGCLAVLSLMDSLTPEFDQISRAVQRDHCVWDVDWSEFPMTNTEFLRISRDVTQALYLRSMAKLGTDDIEGALSDLELMLRLNEQTDKNPFFITLICNEKLLRYVEMIIWEGVKENQFSFEDLNRIQTVLSRYAPDVFWKKVCIAENAYAIAAYDHYFDGSFKRYESTKDPWMEFELIEGDPLPSMSWDDEAIKFISRVIFTSIPNGWFRQNLAGKIDQNTKLIKSTKTLNGQLPLVDPAYHGRGAYSFIWNGKEGNSGYSYLLKKWIDATARFSLTKAAIAFEIHFSEHGNYPSTFEALIPKNLAEIPIDPWTDKPMLLDFRPDGRPVIYSVGEDLDDDGGIPQSRKPPRDGDIVWHYSLPAGFDAKAHYDK